MTNGTTHRLLGAAAVLLLLPSLTYAQQPIGEVSAADASVRGSVVVDSGGTEVLSGSQITASAAAAVLRLHRGGDVRICPNTSLSVSASPSGKELMFAMNSGALEVHYSLGAVADVVMTPDFRIQLVGPGTFHFAISSDDKGNTCIKPTAGNAASLIVTELMGTGTYQVKPDEAVIFPEGHLANAVQNVPACGCPRPEPPPASENQEPKEVVPAPPNSHVEVDAPFVYQGNGRTPDLTYYMAKLRTRSTMAAYRALEPTVLPPPSAGKPREGRATAKKPSRGFFGAIKSFFRRIFH